MPLARSGSARPTSGRCVSSLRREARGGETCANGGVQGAFQASSTTPRRSCPNLERRTEQAARKDCKPSGSRNRAATSAERVDQSSLRAGDRPSHEGSSRGPTRASSATIGDRSHELGRSKKDLGRTGASGSPEEVGKSKGTEHKRHKKEHKRHKKTCPRLFFCFLCSLLCLLCSVSDPVGAKPGEVKGGRWGSNPRPLEPQSSALPAELRPPERNFESTSTAP